MRTPHTSPAKPSDDCSQNFLRTGPLWRGSCKGNTAALFDSGQAPTKSKLLFSRTGPCRAPTPLVTDVFIECEAAFLINTGEDRGLLPSILPGVADELSSCLRGRRRHPDLAAHHVFPAAQAFPSS